MDVVIYHNPACGTSRNTLGADPQRRRRAARDRVPEVPADARHGRRSSPQRTGLGVRGLLREKGTPYAELGLGDPSLSDERCSTPSRRIRS